MKGWYHFSGEGEEIEFVFLSISSLTKVIFAQILKQHVGVCHSENRVKGRVMRDRNVRSEKWLVEDCERERRRARNNFEIEDKGRARYEVV